MSFFSSNKRKKMKHTNKQKPTIYERKDNQAALFIHPAYKGER